MNKTLTQYKQVIAMCKSLFLKKNQDYGSAWRILRLASITDQIFIKAKRIRNIQEQRAQLVPDDVESEFVGIVNYCLIALMQLELKPGTSLDLRQDTLVAHYDKLTEKSLSLLEQKNYDYREAWREMRVTSITDLILMKLLRVKSIENRTVLLASEGVQSGYYDVMNYAVFALILTGFLEEQPEMA